MKKMRKLLLVCLMVMLSLTIVSCGSSSSDGESSDTASDSLVAGKTFVFESYTVDGEDLTDEMTAMYSAQRLAFEEDGTCVQTIVWADEYAQIMGSDPVEVTGTYEETDGSVTVTFESDEGDTVMEFSADGDTLTMDEDGYVTVYTVE